MKTPAALQPLIDDGVIDEVIRSLKSGKEATVYLVRAGAHTRCAKVYRDMKQRSFQKRARYQEGSKVRGSRQEPPFRAQGTGSGLEERRSRRAVQTRRGRSARAEALRLLQRHAAHGAR